MPQPRYVVHILGPDDMLDQPDRATAMRAAHNINAELLEMSDADLNHELAPTVWAVVKQASA